MSPSNSLLSNPAYLAAAHQERLVRDAAFLLPHETVAGFQLRPMTLRDYLTLRLAACPIALQTGTPTPAELARFLWLLSTINSPTINFLGPLRFWRRCRQFNPPSPPWFPTKRALARWKRRRQRALEFAARVLNAARHYMRETMQDRPGQERGHRPSYYSDPCTWWGTLGRNGYHLTRAEILDTPLKILFQCLREIRAHNGQPLNNPATAAVLDAELHRLNSRLPSPSPLPGERAGERGPTLDFRL